jgi:bacillithiol system protein YtxJ
MGLFSSTPKKPAVNWVNLTSSAQLHELIKEAATTPVLLFKHSTRCSISAMALNRFEKEWDDSKPTCICVYLDLIANREISNEIATLLKVEHQSPQAILVRNDEVIYVESHNGISASSIQALI